MAIFSNNRPSTCLSLRLCSFVLCALPCLLTGCVANWSVLGERIPGGTHPTEVACSTCAAPQGVVAGTVQTATPQTGAPSVPEPQRGSLPPASGTQVSTPAPPVPEVPVDVTQQELIETRTALLNREEAIAALTQRESVMQDVVQKLVIDLENMRSEMRLRNEREAQQKAEDRKELEEFRKLNQELVEILQSSDGSQEQTPGAPAPLRTPPSPQAPEAVNELKTLPPANGSL